MSFRFGRGCGEYGFFRMDANEDAAVSAGLRELLLNEMAGSRVAV